MSSPLPAPLSLSRLYNDTKKSTDFLREPVRNEEDPHTKALHCRLRIQKDRLVSWGLEWSEPTQAPEIDDSISEAGLAEVVSSIMSAIKDNLAEAEALWLAKSLESSRPPVDRKPPLVHWDRTRFEDLIRELTVSIDTLYDLSRTRSSTPNRRRPFKAPYKSSVSAEETRLFGSSRVRTPQQIDARQLISRIPIDSDDSQRRIVSLRPSAHAGLAPAASPSGLTSLLLEFATFDPMYGATGIMPEMARFEKLSAALQQDFPSANGSWSGLPRLMGYFEDLERSRLGLVYSLPFSTDPSLETSPENQPMQLETLDRLLSRPESEPPLEAKFRLAFNIANTVFDMHSRGFTHGSLRDRAISFCVTDSAGGSCSDIRRPLLSSFSLFEETDSPIDGTSSSRKSTDGRVSDLRSLALALLSIGLWTNVDPALDLASSAFGQLLDRLVLRCGSLFAKAVRECCHVIDGSASDDVDIESRLASVQTRASRKLETCCLLDDTSGWDGGPVEEDVRKAAPKTSPRSQPAQHKTAVSGNSGSDRKTPTDATDLTEQRNPFQPDKNDDLVASPARSETKIRLYPHVPLAPEAVEQWNKTVMPQIDHALRHFNRKYPESVEVSLESVGPSPTETQPTILVVCTSVGKVRSILKKRLGHIFIGSEAIFGLKVCRGQVVRSRRLASPNDASSSEIPSSQNRPSGPGTDTTTDSKYQRCPSNGASIGAWIGDRHLLPVSFGGLVMVDDEPYGMTVHHMLDDPDVEFGPDETKLSGAAAGYLPEAFENSRDSDVYGFSDTDDESGSDVQSDYDDESEDGEFEPGDIPGVEPECGEEYLVTQPALDDVDEGFHACAETANEDHLAKFGLGNVYASSGIRRKEAHGLLHEMDWALFKFCDGRLPDDNRIPKAATTCPKNMQSGENTDDHLLRPTSVAPMSALPGLEVQCVARTTGVQTGQILPALTSIKIHGRKSPSHTYQVTSSHKDDLEERGKSLGIPGDSGAWIVDSHHGRLCGHVLAWSQRKRVAYICPMEVLLLDMAETLETGEIRLPGSDFPATSARADSVLNQGDEVPERRARDSKDDATAYPAGGPKPSDPDSNSRRPDMGPGVLEELQNITSRMKLKVGVRECQGVSLAV